MNNYHYRRKRQSHSLIIGVIVSAVLALGFAAIAWKTLYDNDLRVYDHLFTEFVRSVAGPIFDDLMLRLTDLGSATVLLFLTLLALMIFFVQDRRLEGATLLVCVAGSGVLNRGLKLVFARERPDLFNLLSETGYSFPSGHSMASICVYGFLAYIIWRNLDRLYWRLLLLSIAITVVAAVGISRIYLGVHYPTDVAAGFIAGGSWLLACISWLRWRQGQPQRVGWLLK